MKKLLAMLLALLMVAALAGCGAKNDAPAGTDTPSDEDSAMTGDPVTPGDTDKDTAPDAEKPSDDADKPSDTENAGDGEVPTEPETPSKPSEPSAPSTPSTPVTPPAAEPEAPAAGEKSLADIMDSILSGAPDLPGVQNIELNADNFEFYAFVAPGEGVTGLASDAMIGSIAHSVVLLRAADEDSAKALAADVQANANPRKWICVEAEKTIISVHGTTVLLVMSFTDTADAIAANFDALYN